MTVSPPQAVEREHETLKQSVGELCDNKGVRRIGMSQGSRLHRRGYAIAWTSREVTVAVTVHDKVSDLW